MTNSIITGLQSFMTPGKLQPGKSASAVEAPVQDAPSAEQKFLDYAKKSPAEKLRDALLQSIGVTEDELKSMPPEQRQQVEQKIADKLKEELQKKAGSGDGAKGFFTDISA